MTLAGVSVAASPHLSARFVLLLVGVLRPSNNYGTDLLPTSPTVAGQLCNSPSKLQSVGCSFLAFFILRTYGDSAAPPRVHAFMAR